MGNRRYVTNKVHMKTGSLKCTKSRLTTGPWPLHIYFNTTHAMILCLPCTILRSNLSRERSTFSGPLETFTAGRTPSHHIANRISYGDDSIIERGLNMSHTVGDIFLLFLFLNDFFCWASHYSSRHLWSISSYLQPFWQGLCVYVRLSWFSGHGQEAPSGGGGHDSTRDP